MFSSCSYFSSLLYAAWISINSPLYSTMNSPLWKSCVANTPLPLLCKYRTYKGKEWIKIYFWLLHSTSNPSSTPFLRANSNNRRCSSCTSLLVLLSDFLMLKYSVSLWLRLATITSFFCVLVFIARTYHLYNMLKWVKLFFSCQSY